MKVKLTLFIVFLLGFHAAKAQNWGGGIDDEKLSFGFTFQYAAAEYKVLKTLDWRNPISLPDGLGNNVPVTNALTSISSQVSPGFGIGFLVNNKITDHVDLRFSPALVFSDRKMVYIYNDGLINEPSTKEVIKNTKATMVDLPLGIKLKSDRIMNFRAYIIGGMKYSLDMASAKKNSNANVLNEMDKNLRNTRNYLSYEAGLGLDLYFEWFKVSPEFKLSYSFKDVIKHEGNVFDTPIDQAKLRHFTFSLFFQ